MRLLGLLRVLTLIFTLRKDRAARFPSMFSEYRSSVDSASGVKLSAWLGFDLRVCVCVCAVSYTHLTLPTSDGV